MSTQHAICELCYSKRERRWLPRVKHPEIHTALVAEQCCFCAEPTRARLYTLADERTIPCRGEAGSHTAPPQSRPTTRREARS